MTRNLITLLCVGAIGLGTGCADEPGKTTTNPATQPSVFDGRPYAEAKKAAETEGKWFIVKATAVWCMPCKQMERTTWRDEDVVKWLRERAIVVSLDVDKHEKIAAGLNVQAMPTMIAFKAGQEFDRVVGYQSPKNFLVWLEGIAQGKKSIVALRERAGSRDAPDGEVDIQARLDLAQKLVWTGKLDEATEEYVWLWQNMLNYEQAMVGVRLSFMASSMADLAKRHKPAHEQFAKLRDELTKKLAAEKVDPHELMDWVCLNQVVGESEKTLAWFDKIKSEPRWRPLFRYVERDLRDLLVAADRWADVALFVEDPVEELERDYEMMKMLSKESIPDGLSEAAVESMVEGQYQMARESAGYTYAALLAGEREKEAAQFAKRARELDDSAALLRALISTALRAGEPRRVHLEWIDSTDDQTDRLDSLRPQVEHALKNAEAEK
jgi:thioredoxin 1